MNLHIFKEYDIRGVVEKDFPEEVVTAIAKAFSTYGRMALNKDRLTIAVGRDVRLSSPLLFEWLTAGLMGMGVRVIDLGVCPTPLVYFSLFELPVDGAVMITGSHNPKEYNGFKLCYNRTTLFGKQIQALREIIEGKRFAEPGTGEMSRFDIIQAYSEYQRRRHQVLAASGKKLKVVIDGGNGTAGLVAPHLFRDLGCEVVELFCEPDGAFPNHHPDPTIPENLAHLVEKVRATGADLGLAFDGDADRLGVVDERGTVLWGDEIMVILARDILARHPGAAVIGEVKCSSRMYREIERAGGRAIMWKTGHSLIKNKLKEEHALLAGEMSGHIFFSEEFFGFDDAIHAALEVATILARARAEGPFPMSGFLSGLPPVKVTPEIRTDCPDEVKFRTIEGMRAGLRAHQASGGVPKILGINEIDGVRVDFEQGWGLLRASNTQPVLVSRFEAQTDELLGQYRRFFEGLLARVTSR